jgi:glucose/arabinose dehydrogenase
MGGNYGWPDAAGKVGPGAGDGKWIDPSWDSYHMRFGPTGLAFYTGNAVPEWRNNLFFCDWNTGSLWRIDLLPPDHETLGQVEPVTQPCRLYVRSGPDGALYFSDHHAIYRLGPTR